MSVHHAQGPIRDVPGRIDIEAVFKDVPIIEDVSDLALPEAFESDDELDEFLTWFHAERKANIG